MCASKKANITELKEESVCVRFVCVEREDDVRGSPCYQRGHRELSSRKTIVKAAAFWEAYRSGGPAARPGRRVSPMEKVLSP